MTKQDERAQQADIPAVSHVLETSLYVSNIDRAKAFYENLFGFIVIFQDDRMCAMQVPGNAILLLFKHGASSQPNHTAGGVIPPHGSTGAQHLCFAIPLASQDAWTRHLEALNIPLESRVRQHFGGTSLYFRDPDGHSIEVAVPGLWPNY